MTVRALGRLGGGARSVQSSRAAAEDCRTGSLPAAIALALMKRPRSSRSPALGCARCNTDLGRARDAVLLVALLLYKGGNLAQTKPAAPQGEMHARGRSAFALSLSFCAHARVSARCGAAPAAAAMHRGASGSGVMRRTLEAAHRRALCSASDSHRLAPNGGRVHWPCERRQSPRRGRLRVHGRLALPGRLEGRAQMRPWHA